MLKQIYLNKSFSFGKARKINKFFFYKNKKEIASLIKQLSPIKSHSFLVLIKKYERKNEMIVFFSGFLFKILRFIIPIVRQ